jgi:hypothetical protein
MGDATHSRPADRRPTLVFVVWHGFVARYFLRTGILPALTRAGVRVVALVPNPDEEYLREELEPQGVELEPLRVEHRLGSAFLTHLRQHAMANGHTSLAFRKRYEKFRAKHRRGKRLRTLAMDAGVRALWRSRRLRAALVRAEERTAGRDLHADIFDRVRPGLVVLASTGYLAEDNLVGGEARRRGIPTATVVPAWDNTSSNGYGGALPERVIVWSERMAAHMTRFQDIPADRLRVAGVALFDPYVSGEGIPPRDELLRSLGLDPARRTILFATCSPRLYGDSLDVAEHLARELARGTFGEAQVVVRLHPASLKAKSPESPEAYRAMAARYDHVHVDVPELRSDALVVDTPPEETLRVQGLLTHSDVFVNVFSTMTLEACLVDKPTVVVNWTVGAEAEGAAARRSWLKPWMTPFYMRWGDYVHQQEVVARGAVRVAGTFDEITRLVRVYLDDPALDRRARAEVARLETGPTDGRSGERIAEQLLELLGVGAPGADDRRREPAAQAR